MIDAPQLFLSYRRDDSADITGRIYDRLAERFGKEVIFRDVDTIPLGVDFRVQIEQMVGRCNVLLAIIGPDWIKVTDIAGGRRLDDPMDFVRLEIESALVRKIPVIPLLVRGAEMPQENKLPVQLKDLAYRNGIPIRRDPDFHNDLNRLIDGLATQLPGLNHSQTKSVPIQAMPIPIANSPTFNLSGNIQAGQVNMGGTQNFEGPIEVDMSETHIHEPKSEVVIGDKVEMSGDFRGGSINFKSHLENAAQTIEAFSFVEESNKAELLKLLQELKSALAELPEEKAVDAEKVSSRVAALARESSEVNPDREMMSMTAESLTRAAKNIADVIPSAIPIAAQIITAILNLR